METSPDRFEPFRHKMLTAGLPDLAIRKFEIYFRQLLAGLTGTIPESDIGPVRDLCDSETLTQFREAGRSALGQAVIIKLNGGLGTSMGLDRAKVLLPAKNTYTFLDLIVRQILELRSRTGCPAPVIFMNSLNTHDDTRAHLAGYPRITSDVPLDFLQHRVPKIDAETLLPVEWPADPDLEWYPPGHGDIYSALLMTGLLDDLLSRGFRYAFVSNADNLGAVMDLDILGYFAVNGFSFLMEVADRTEADKKGGHLARHETGRLTLREVAQCPPQFRTEFEDIARYNYFNTNTIWLDLSRLQKYLDAHDGIVDLPMITNLKTVDPTRPDSRRVMQLETAMGAAISVFDDAMAVRVPRSRFKPVKTCQDLLLLWSDQYLLAPDYTIVRNPSASVSPRIALDPNYYRMIGDLLDRFPKGAPSLAECTSLTVEGDVEFGADVQVKGEVRIVGPSMKKGRIPDGSILENAALEL